MRLNANSKSKDLNTTLELEAKLEVSSLRGQRLNVYSPFNLLTWLGVISLSYSSLGLLISHYSPYHLPPGLGSICVDSSSGCFPLLHSYACTKFIFGPQIFTYKSLLIFLQQFS